MSDILEKICVDKREHVARCKTVRPLATLEAAAAAAPAPLGFAQVLEAGASQGGWGLIAEIKRASPSAGEIRPDFDPASLARAYRQGGASCLSVLTDEPYFRGRDSYVMEAREASELPCLRKDFIVDPYQVLESRAIGADCILLIAAALDDERLAELYRQAVELGMDVLVEVHDAHELSRCLPLSPMLLGINNRDLRSFDVSLSTTEALLPDIPDGTIVVTESGILGVADVMRMRSAGVHAFLVGEAFMRAEDPGKALQMMFDL